MEPECPMDGKSQVIELPEFELGNSYQEMHY